MTVVQCRSCQHVMSADPDGRLPPWCPMCGSDLKAKPEQAASEQSEEERAESADLPAETPQLAQARVGRTPVAQPPMVLPADDPGSLENGLAGARHASYHRSPSAWAGCEDRERKPKQNLASKLGMMFGVVGGVVAAQIVAPQIFPQPPGGFSVQQMMLAGVLGGMGAAVGAILGKLIDGLRS